MCRIPSSKRQHDAADDETGRLAGGGRGGEGSWKAAVAVCPSLLSGLKTSRPGDQQAGKVETKCPNESVNDLLVS